MVLVFGGTTEGRKAVEELEDAGNTFYYSTKTGEQDVPLKHGIAISGAMTHDDMIRFCRGHDIRLLIDAAHPFAEHLHTTVATVAKELCLPAIRFERIYPKHYDGRIEWSASFDELAKRIDSMGRITVLATTGVQSISKLRRLSNAKVYYRILLRESSIALAHEQGASDDELCFYNEETDKELFQRVKPDIVIVKDSGESGGFTGKVNEALSKGIRVFALKRPTTPTIFNKVNGPHGLRRMMEKLLPNFYPLRSGLTTGTCATASAIAATVRLLSGKEPSTVNVILPNGETIPVAVGYGDGYAFTMKDAGDDPDVTDGLEIRATVEHSDVFTIDGGDGVGRITIPGFDSPVGEAAINRVPREMIRHNIEEQFPPPIPLRITISVPDGKRISERTFNPRLGIVGGISIVGVSGIVKPFSEESFVASIKKCIDVAKASGSKRLVINSGAKSERFVRSRYPDLPAQAFVEYGNLIGETIRMASDAGFHEITLGIMLGKAVKLAAGNLDTHSKRTVLDKAFIAQMLNECGCSKATINALGKMTLARELWNIVPADLLQSFTQTVINHCMEHCAPLLPDGRITIMLIDENGKIY